jgi:hypothetical protein
VNVVGIRGGSVLVLMIEIPPHFILMAGLLYIYIKGFSTLNSGYGGHKHKDVAPALYMLPGT